MAFPAFFLLAGALGAREGIINRRDKQNRLDQEADRQTAINDIDLGIDTQSVGNQFDQEQIAAMRQQHETAQAMLRSSDEKLQAIGANMIQNLSSAVRGNIQQNETEFRADEVRRENNEIAAAGVGKKDNEKRFDREMTMNNQLIKALAPVRESEVFFDKITNSLANGDITGSQIAMTAMIQAIDGSVVRGEELRNYQSTNGAVNFFVNALNKIEGGDLTEETKISIRNGGAALVNAERSRGIAITESFQDRALSFGLDPKRVMSGVDQNLFTPAAINRDAQIALENKADAAEAQLASGDLQELDGGAVAFVGSTIVRGASDTVSEIRRSLSGTKLIRNANGELFEQDQNGDIKSVGRDNKFTDATGQKFELIDHGGGRMEWVKVGVTLKERVRRKRISIDEDRDRRQQEIQELRDAR